MQGWGKLTSIDLKKCNPRKVSHVLVIKDYVIQICDLIKMKRYGECYIVDFGEDEKVKGFSMTQLIETSLISAHFVNLTNNIYIDIFSCADYDSDSAANFSKNFFDAEEMDVNVTHRL